MMVDRRHWPLEAIAEYVDGTLPIENEADLRQHLSACRTCAEQLDWVRRVSVAARGNELVAPPAWVVERAQRLFCQVEDEGMPSVVEKILARLTYDSSSLSSVADVRGVPTSLRRVLYSAGDYDVDLQVQSGHAKTERKLQGQVMSRSTAGGTHCEVELHCGPERVIGRRLVPDGEFSFDRLRPGSYGLRVRVGRKEIELEDVRL